MGPSVLCCVYYVVCRVLASILEVVMASTTGLGQRRANAGPRWAMGWLVAQGHGGPTKPCFGSHWAPAAGNEAGRRALIWSSAPRQPQTILCKN